MNSIVYIACLLVAYSAASPAQSHPRRCEGSYGCSTYADGGLNGFNGINGLYRGGYGGGYGGAYQNGFAGNGFASSHQEQQQQQQSSSAHTNSYNNGAGSYGASSDFNQQSSSSSSSSTVFSGFSLLASQIGQLQTGLSSRSINQQTVTQQMSQLAISFQSALSSVSSCGSCFNQANFPASLSGVFEQFTRLLTSIQSNFGRSYNQICAPFSGLANAFQSFFRSAYSSGYSINHFVPQGLPNLLGPVIPGFGQSL